MNSYASARYPPLMRSVSSPTPTSQMGGVVGQQGGAGGGGGGMDTNASIGASRDQMANMLASSTTPSTTPPPPPSSSTSGATPTTTGGTNANNGAMIGTPSAPGTNSTFPPNTNNSALAANSANSAGGGGPSNSSSNRGNNNNTTAANAGNAINREQVYTWIQELSSLETREHALIELSRKREVLPDLAPMLWHSFGTIAALLQEIVTIYPVINPPTLNAQQSNRVCNALALLQCVASHPETRSAFLNAHIPLFLYPFLHTVSKSRPFEYLRLTSLGVVGALVKTDEQDVINFLLTTEIIPLCLRIMESGSELSKTVATFILQKILLDETGLSYICQTFERFSHVASVLDKMVQQLGKDPSTRLLKHVVRCYLRLSDNLRAREALRTCLPEQLKDSTFAVTLKDDSTTKKWLSQLLQNLGIEGQLAAVATTTASSAVTTAATSQ